MKKTYTKPYLVVESFQLDAAIAASCSPTKGSLGYSVNTCTLSDEKGTYAPTLHVLGLACGSVGEVDIVNPKPGSDENDGYCYHGPTHDVAEMFMNS